MMKKISILFFLLFALLATLAHASSSDGTINAAFKYAWSENIGWLNFGATGGNVHITASKLTGYIWSDNYGWINLDPAGSGVKNDGIGKLSGSAWGERTGYIDFNNVGIDSEGSFGGTANGSTTGRIVFSCAHCRVVTDWRPAPVAPSSGSGGGGGSSGGYAVAPPTPSPPTSTTTPAPAPTSAPVNVLITALSKAAQFLESLIPSGVSTVTPASPPVAVAKPEIVPPVFKRKWSLLTEKPISSFVFAPLPKELLRLTEKFPKLQKAFESLGISRQADLLKLRSAQLSLPGFSASPKGRVPLEIVFARSRDGKIDRDVRMELSDKGVIQKKFQAVAGSKVQFAVKPAAPAHSVRGYILLKNRGRGVSFDGRSNDNKLTLREALASLVFQTPVFAKAVPPEKEERERRLAVAEFEYHGPDKSGVYTAEVTMPSIDGEYDVVTIISYKDPDLGTREISLIAAVDPEGYIYEKQGNKQVRIPQAKVSLFSCRRLTNTCELWPAREYGQTNPQVTDVRGTYAFFVPPGYYSLSVEAPEYEPHTGERFSVETGNEVHSNIELQPKKWWKKIGDGFSGGLP